MRTYRIVQGSILSVLWWPKWEGNRKKERIYCTYGWFALLHGRDWHCVVKQIYPVNTPSVCDRVAHFSSSTHRCQCCKCSARVLTRSVASSSLQPHGLQPGGLICPWILQARILEWVAISSLSRPSRPRDRTHLSCISCIGRWIVYHWATVPIKYSALEQKLVLKKIYSVVVGIRQ